jgi:uncharacterized protein
MAIALAILVGTLIGVLLGLIGGGRSILTVPILVYLLGQNVHEASATSLVIVAINSPAGATAQMGSGTVDLSLAALFIIIGSFAEVAVGGWLAEPTKHSCHAHSQRLWCSSASP